MDAVSPERTRVRSRAFGWARQIFGVALGLLLLGWLIYIADLRAVSYHLAHVSFLALTSTVFLSFLAIPVRALQWQMLLGYSAEVSFRRTLKSICIGYLGNFLLPMRGGELVRAYILSKDSKLPLGRVLVSVFLSRVQDLPPIGVLVAIVVIAIPITPEAIQRTGEILGVPLPRMTESANAVLTALGVAAICSAVGVLGLYLLARPLADWFSRRLDRNSYPVANRIMGFVRGVESGIRIIGNARLFWGAQLLSFFCWVIYVLSPIPLLMAFSLTLFQAFYAAVAKAAITTFASLLPSAPGTVGTFHAFCLLSLLVVNPTMDRDAALAYVFIAHLISTLGPALPGLAYLPSSWNDLVNIRKGVVRPPLEMQTRGSATDNA